MLSQGSQANAVLRSFAYDAKRFVMSYVSMMAKYPLQIYCSALISAPYHSLVRQRFLPEIPPWISFIPAVRGNWSGKMLTMETTFQVITEPSNLQTHDQEALVFSPNGQTLALGTLSRGISFWDPTTGASRGTIAPPGRIYYVTMDFSSDGRFLAYVFIGPKGRLIGLWDVALQAVRSINQDNQDKYSSDAKLRFSPTSEFFAVSASGEAVRLFDTRSLAVTDLTTTNAPLTMTFSPSGRYLAVASCSKEIHVEDIIAGKSVVISAQYVPWFCCCSFSPSDELLAYSAGHTIEFWRPDDSCRPPNLGVHTDNIGALVFSPNGRLLASLCSRQCSVWDVTSGARLYCVEKSGKDDCPPLISPDSHLLAWQTDDRTVSFWCATTGKPHGSLQTSSKCTFMAFAPNSQLFASASSSGEVDIWDVNKLPTGHDGVEKVVATASSSNGQYLASVSRVGLLRVWEMMTRDFCCVLKTDFFMTESLGISDNASRLALSFNTGTVKVLDLPGGNLSVTTRGQGNRFLAFSPDGQLAVTANMFQGLVVHDNGTGSRTNVANTSSKLAAFSAEGNHLAAAFNGRITVFSGSGWQSRRNINFNWEEALTIALHNKWIACARKTSIELLDLSKGGACVAILSAQCEPGQLSFSSDGRQLVTELGVLTLPARDVAVPLSEEDAWLNFHIRDEWVMYDGRKVLWLPPDCRQLSNRAFHANMLAWSHEKGKVHYVAFDPAQMARTSGRPTMQASACKWERPPKDGFVRKCKRILGRISTSQGDESLRAALSSG